MEPHPMQCFRYDLNEDVKVCLSTLQVTQSWNRELIWFLTKLAKITLEQ